MPADPNALSDDQLRGLIDIGFDYVCGLRVSDFVDATRILPALDDALAAERIAAFQARFIAPSRERIVKRFEESDRTMSVWLPSKLAAEIETELGKPAPIPRRFIDEAVGSEKVREAVRTMLSETLEGFVAKATGEGPATGAAGAGGALRGAFGFGARAAAAAGKGLLGGLGDELQRRLREKATDFVDASVTTVQAKIAERLASDETARAIGKRRVEAFNRVLATREPDAAKTYRKSKPEQIERAIPEIVAHNLARAEVRDAIVSEVEHSVAELSKSTLGALLDDAGLRDHMRQALHAHGLPLMRKLAQLPAFAAWWATATG